MQFALSQKDMLANNSSNNNIPSASPVVPHTDSRRDKTLVRGTRIDTMYGDMLLRGQILI